MRFILPLLAIVGAVVVLRFPDRKTLRIVVVSAITLALLSVTAGLIAPHRLAELQHGPQGEEWRRGASATRDVIHSLLPLLASAFTALVVLALTPMSRHMPNKPVQPTRAAVPSGQREPTGSGPRG